MRNVVKNTSKCGLLDLLCPYTCRGCGQLGEVICGCCKKNLLGREGMICPLCKKCFAESGENVAIKKCPECDLGFEMVAVGGWREDVLARLIKDYKYKSVRAAGDCLVDLLDIALERAGIEDFGDNVVVVPLPTIGKHVRQRGFDHTLDLAKKLARRRGWKCERILRRAVDTVQVGAKMATRREQAMKAYEAVGELNENMYYLLIDDVWTTGASVKGAACVMGAAGAKKLLVAVVATGREKSQAEK